MSLLDLVKNASGHLEQWFNDNPLMRLKTSGEFELLTRFLETKDLGAIAGDASAVTEYGPRIRQSVVTFSDTQAVAGAALAFGAAAYTTPAVPVAIFGAYISGTATAATSTDTPEVGLGTTVGSGANATLGAVGAGAENLIEGAAISAISASGTAFTAQSAPAKVPLILAASQTLYVNVADTWTPSEDVTVAGTLRVLWAPLGEV